MRLPKSGVHDKKKIKLQLFFYLGDKFKTNKQTLKYNSNNHIKKIKKSETICRKSKKNTCCFSKFQTPNLEI